MKEPAAQINLVRRVCRSLVRSDSHLAEDLEQDTHLAILASGLDVGVHDIGWIHSVAKHRLFNLKNRSARAPATHPITDYDLSTGDGGPAAVCETREVNDAVRRSVARLPKIYRSVILECIVRGESTRDVSRRSGLSVETVRSRKKRGVTQLRRDVCLQR